MKPCPSRERLEKLLSDQLSDSEEFALDDHVKGCALCLKTLEALTGIAEPPSKVLSTQVLLEARAEPGPDDPLISRLVAGPLVSSSSRSHPVIEGFEILGKLGHGGMGVVYKARQVDLQRTVALKMVLAGAHADPQSLARFRAEAEAVAQLQHPNIVQIHAVGEADGLPYYSMEYVEGGTLAQEFSGTPVVPRRAAQLVEVLARAMHYAHARGVVHRDLKPANVLLTLDGAPKITDFGLAKRSDSGIPSTEVGLAVGTPRYMAPEQLSPLAKGEKRVVGPASDIYALGAILYELLTGRPLYTGDSTLDVVVRVLHEEPTPPHVYHPSVPRDLGTISLKCLAKNPSQRYASAQELADDLDRYLCGQPIQARPPALLYRAGKYIRRNKGLVGAAVAVALALSAGIVATSIAAFREMHQRDRAESNAQQAESARQDALLEAYQARLAAALAALGDHNVGEARNHLNAVPPGRRGWEWHYVDSRLDDSISSLHVSSQWLVPCSGGQRIGAITPAGIRIWDAYSGAVLATVAADGTDGFGIFTTTAGSFFGQWDTGLLLLRTETGHTRQRFALANETATHAVALDPAGTRLAHASFRGKEELVIFDIATGGVLRRCDPPMGEMRGLAYSPDGRLLAGGGDDRVVQIWDAESGVRLKVLTGHDGSLYSIVFSPDGRRILSASADGTFCQWDVASGKLLDQRYGHGDRVNEAIYSPDGAWIISAGGDGTVRYWGVAGGPALNILHGATAPITSLAVKPDGKRVTSVSRDSTSRVFEGPGQGDARVLRGHTSYVYPVAYSPDGRLLASGGWDKVVRLWDTETGLPVGVLAGHEQYVASLAFSPDSRHLASRSPDGTVRIWDVEARKALAVVPYWGIGLADTPHRIAVTPDNTRVACPNGDRLTFWDVETGKETGSLLLASEATRVAEFRPDGKQIASIGEGNDVYLVDANTGELQATLRGHREGIHDVSYSADGKLLVSAGADNDVRVWDTTTGECLHVLRGHTGSVFAAVFHPDGTRIASGGRDRAIRIWDTASGAELARLPGHTDYVFSLQFSPDGASLASGSGDYTVRLWDTFPVARRLQKRARWIYDQK